MVFSFTITTNDKAGIDKLPKKYLVLMAFGFPITNFLRVRVPLSRMQPGSPEAASLGESPAPGVPSKPGVGLLGWSRR